MSVRTDQLTTMQLHNLDEACKLIVRAFGGNHPYLVGTAGYHGNIYPGYRDVDIRLILNAEEFDRACPTRERWEMLCVAITAYLSERTGLPVDFQIQREEEANKRFGAQRRNPLGTGRTFAGGGDGAPW